MGAMMLAAFSSTLVNRSFIQGVRSREVCSVRMLSAVLIAS